MSAGEGGARAQQTKIRQYEVRRLRKLNVHSLDF